MYWPDGMNAAIAYIEQNLDGEIDYKKAARVTGCSLNKLQNFFQFAADTTISEYVRKRRMSLAAADLIKNDVKIIDLAVKYGYECVQ